jgi:hypothetical protein
VASAPNYATLKDVSGREVYVNLAHVVSCRFKGTIGWQGPTLKTEDFGTVEVYELATTKDVIEVISTDLRSLQRALGIKPQRSRN